MSNLSTLVRNVSAFDVASELFQASLASVGQSTTAHNGNREASKVTASDLKNAERVSLWLLFDAACLADDATDAAEGFALDFATAKGVAVASMYVYAQRGRDMISQRAPLAKMTTEQREKTNPMSAAKKLRVDAVAAKDRVAATVAHIGPAKDAVAERLNVSRDMLDAMIEAGDELAKAAVAEAMEARMSDAGILSDMATAIDAYHRADVETRATIRAKWEAAFAA